MKKLITIFILILLMTLGDCNLTPKKYEKEVRETINSYIPTLKDTINVEYHYIDSLKRYQSDNNKTVYSYLNYQEEMLKEEFIYNDNIESSRKYIFKNGSYQLESEEDKLISLDEYKDKHQFFNFDNLDFNKAKYTYKVTNRLSSQPSRDILFNFDKNL